MFDLVFHDNDEGQGGNNNLTWSPNNRDLAYLDQFEWTNTWIGDTTHVSATSIGDNAGHFAGNYELRQNYPNPFNPETTIEFAIAKAGNVEIHVYNLLGQNVMTLVNEEMNAGRHQVKFDGNTLSSGVYFYAIKTADFFQTRKMILLK
jgi:flagellar hook assembly protein FlgD